MNTYIYEGPVLAFGKPIAKKWRGYTQAVSSKKAVSNLKFRFKTTHGLTMSTKIDLPAPILLASDI